MLLLCCAGSLPLLGSVSCPPSEIGHPRFRVGFVCFAHFTTGMRCSRFVFSCRTPTRACWRRVLASGLSSHDRNILCTVANRRFYKPGLCHGGWSCFPSLFVARPLFTACMCTRGGHLFFFLARPPFAACRRARGGGGVIFCVLGLAALRRMQVHRHEGGVCLFWHDRSSPRAGV